jgi:hypothetical protein
MGNLFASNGFVAFWQQLTFQVVAQTLLPDGTMPTVWLN